MEDISKLDLIQTSRFKKKNDRFGSITPYMLRKEILNELFVKLTHSYKTQLGKLSEATSIINSIVSFFEANLLNEALLKYLNGDIIGNPFATDNTKVRYVHYYIIETILSDKSFATTGLSPFRINKQFSTLEECLCLYILLLENNCTNIDIDNTTIQAKLQSLPDKSVSSIEQFISKEFKVGVLKISHNKKGTPLYDKPVILKRFTDNKKYIVILYHRYSGVDYKYEAIIFNNDLTGNINCTLQTKQVGSKKKSRSPALKIPAAAPKLLNPKIVNSPKPVVKSKKIVVKSKKIVVKSKKIVINKLKQISIDPLDNGEELPIIVCEIDGESERYLLGKTNILYSLDTPAKLIGKLNITDESNKLGTISLCSS